MRLPSIDDPVRRWLGRGGLVAAVLVVALVALLLFGWGLLKGTVERRLSHRLDRAVTIGSIRRVGGLSLDPLLELRDVRVAQPAWAGPGDMLRLRLARIRLSLLPLLRGKLDPQAIVIDGLRLALVRDAAGHANWRRDGARPSGAGSPDLGVVTLTDGLVTLDDAERQRRLKVRLAIDAQGLRAAGTGSIAGRAATISFTGAPVAEQRAWPFRLVVASPLVGLVAEGRMRTPLDVGHFAARIDTRGHDLRDLDRLIEAGLFATQPFHLTGVVRHDRPAWIVDRLAGTLGRSHLAGSLALHKERERTLLQGRFTSDGFDFDDLASNEDLATAAQRERRIGPRFVPATRIDLSKLRRLDGTLRIDIRRLLFRQPSALRSASASLTLDHGVLTVAPLIVGLTRGRVLGTAIVRHQSGLPRLMLDLRLVDGRLEQLLTTPSTATGLLTARVRLAGRGKTVREAVGGASGWIGLYASGGTADRRIALAAGSDVGRAFFTAAGRRVPLRCIVGRFAVADGIGRPAPLVLDSTVSQSLGSGTINLTDERLALSLKGTPKQSGGLRVDRPIRVSGSFKHPALEMPGEAGSPGGILSMIGKTIGGHQPVAVDADCEALATKALR